MIRNALAPIVLPDNMPDISRLTNPLAQGMATYRQGMDKQFEGERALAREQLQRDQFGLQQRADTRAQQAHETNQYDHAIKQIGGLAQAALAEQDPARRGALMQRIYGMHPEMVTKLQASGVDPNDHPRVASMFVAEARGIEDPDKKALVRAQINNLNRREEPDIVRTLRAAGVDPKSPQGQQLIMNSIKGGDPISQAIAQQINGQPAQPQSPIRPQSFDSQPETPPGIVLTQAGGQQPVSPQADTVDTPLGPMPRDRARLLGFGIAMSGKGDAGKMFSEAANAGNLGKEAQNEIDKKMVAASDNLTNLASVRAQFRPEFQQIETRLGMAWTALADKFKKGQAFIKPEDRAQLEAFAAYRADALDTMNNYIKAITGAAMTDSEAKRILGALPAVGEGVFDGDGPTSFKAKLDAAFDKTAAAIARYNYARSNGKDWQMIGIEQMKGIVRQRGAQLEQQLRQSNPGASKAMLESEVTKRIKQEFGI